jgi:CubicO group peptidase (beta-lactamase class C family)
MKNKPFKAVVSLHILLLVLAGNGIHFAKAASHSDTATYTAIDDYIKERMQTLKIPGAALAIVQGDQIEYLQGYGIADPTGRAVTPQTPFMLASVSKSFTALAIMQLAEEGKLDLDAPVQKFLTWFQIADKEVSAEITVRQLLNQTSGFSQTDGNKMNLVSSTSNDALIASMKQLDSTQLINTPGTAFEYSNINYGLLGAIVETVSGQSYETYIQQNIFTPLDMKHSFTSLSDAKSNGASSGYYPFFGTPIVYDNLMSYSRAMTSWAGLFSSAEDMGHYMIAHLNEGKYGEKALLSPKGIAELHNFGIKIDKWSGYAMGWSVGPDFDIAYHDQTSYTAPIALSHEGSWVNFRSIVMMVPQKKIGVVLLMNTNDPAIESAFGSVGWDVLSIYLGNQPSYYPPSEDYIRQHARMIFVVINILLLASFIWFLRKLKGWRRQPMASTPHWRKLFGYVVIPIAIDLLLAWFLLAKEIPQAKSTVMGTLRGAPDIGLLTVLVLLFAIGWGTIRTLLMLRAIFRKP